MSISAALVQDLFSYNPETGEFTRKARRQGARVGQVCGSPDSHGYLQIKINGRNYFAHRLAWLVVYGEWPKHQIDHIDRNPTNNRIANLREATNSQNNHNRGQQVNNTSGYKGVCWNKRAKRWKAYIKLHGRRTHLGYFNTADAAHAAYCVAAQELHGEFARTS